MLKSKTAKLALLGAIALGMSGMFAPEAHSGWFGWGKKKKAKQDPIGKVEADRARRGNSPLVETDIAEVLNARTPSESGDQIYIPPGVYALGPADSSRDDYVLIVDTFINNPGMGLGLMIPVGATTSYNGTHRTGYLFQIRPVKGGGAMMLAPIGISARGRIKTLTEDRRDQPYLEVKLAGASKERRVWQYHVTRKFNFLREKYGDNVPLRMREKYSQSPELLPSPKQGAYMGWSESGRCATTSLFVGGGQIELGSTNYNMIPLNSEEFGGGFFNLTRSEDNSVTGEGEASSSVSKFAAFLGGCLGDRFLIVLTPTVPQGTFLVESFGPKNRTLWDFLFGRTQRKYKD